jgi:uncharacterized membrane protein/DNA-directed RNA polymerase subunit RPC12/RpoP
MAIEFRCQRCQKLLRVGDDDEGRQALCPDCGAIMPVPARGSVLPDDRAGAAAGSGPFGAAVRQSAASADGENPYASPSAPAYEAPALAVPPGAITPSIIDLGDVFHRSWEIFKTQWPMCAAVAFIVVLLNLTAAVFTGVLTSLTASATGDPAATLLVRILCEVASWAFNTWIGIGELVFFLKTARGQRASVGDIFAGGPWFVNVLAASLLVGLAVLVGLAFCIVPGVILALMFSQYYYLIIDRNLGPVDALSMSAQITRGNKLTLFAIGLVVFAFALFTCGLGLVLLIPFVPLAYAVIYLAMTGQPTAADAALGYQPVPY